MNFQNTHSPGVSILLPVRNGGDDLYAAVETILGQTLKDFELLVLDDGSTDHSVERLVSINDKRVRLVIDSQKQGLAYRLNQGISMSTGKYIARMDADDLAFSHRLMIQKQFLDCHPGVDLVAAKAVSFRGNELVGFLPFRESHKEITRYPWLGLYMPHPTWMGRAEWFRTFNYRIPEIRLAEDQELLLRAMPESTYHAIPEVLLAYNRPPSTLRKQTRARVGLLSAQVKVFRNQKRNLWICLSVLTFVVKLSFDFLRSMFSWLGLSPGFQNKTILQPELVEKFLKLKFKSP